MENLVVCVFEATALCFPPTALAKHGFLHRVRINLVFAVPVLLLVFLN